MFDPRARPTRLITCRCIGKFLFISEFGATDCPFGRCSVHFTSHPRLVFREHLAAAQGKTEMEQIALYKGFRIRVYEDWSGLWLAETKKPFARRPGAGDHEDTDAALTRRSSISLATSSHISANWRNSLLASEFSSFFASSRYLAA